MKIFLLKSYTSLIWWNGIHLSKRKGAANGSDSHCLAFGSA